MATSMCPSACMWPSDMVAVLLRAPAPCSIVAAEWKQVPWGACTEEGVLGLPTTTLSRHLALERCQLRLLLFTYLHHAEHKGPKDRGASPSFISVCTGVSAVGMVYLR